MMDPANDEEEPFEGFGVFRERARKQLGVLGLADLLTKPQPPREFAAGDLFPRDTVSSLYGDGGTGKTMMALDLMLACSLALDGEASWLGRPVAGLSAVGLFAEESHGEMASRLVRLAEARGCTDAVAGLDGKLDILPMLGGGNSPCIMTGGGDQGEVTWTETGQRLCQLIFDRPSIVILDAAAAVFGGDELRRGQAHDFLIQLNALANEEGHAIVLIGHPSHEGMKSGRGYSGSSGWWNHTRQLVTLEAAPRQPGDRETDSRTVLTIRKNNYGPAGRVTHHVFDGQAFSTVDPPAPKAKTNPRHRIALATLRQAIADVPAATPAGEIGTTLDAWRALAAGADLTPSASPAAKRQAFKRARDDLEAAGVIAVSEPFVWMRDERDDA